MEKEIVFCKGGGCTAKLGPAALSRVLQKLPKFEDPNLLVGFDHSDDAAVYRLSDDLAIVQTLDFFPPMVEDPYLFGKIAAANALSDVYAMGGDVKTALNIVCFPEKMDLNILGKILMGGSEKVREAGGVLAGGHSIADEDVKYGLSVTGTIHPDRIFENNRALPGDCLLLTKPLGVGIVCTAQRVGGASEEALKKLELMLGEREEGELPLQHSQGTESVLLTKKEMIGKQLCDLDLQRNFGCMVTCVRRSGIDLSPSPDLELKFGDKLMIVGEKEGLHAVARLFGNDAKKLSDTDFFLALLHLGTIKPGDVQSRN